MNLLQNIKTALRGIAVNKMRSGLTMLGIMIGVGAVIAMISIGSGASASVTSQIQSLGSNLLMVMPGGGQSQGGARQAVGTALTLSNEDAEAIAEQIPAVKQVSPQLSSSAQVVFANQNINSQITGITPSYQEVNNFHVEFGEFVRDEDQNSMSRVAVLGQNVVMDLFPNGEDPIGKTIKIDNVPFTIRGVMELKGGASFQSPDDSIFIPLSTAQRRLFGQTSLGSVYVQVRDEDEMDLASDQITTLLLNRHGIDDEGDADFRIMNQEDILETVSQVTGTLSLLLGGIAAISLLVGGIGIMNIMLVLVTERTREIGLRKAVGAKRKDILGQFLIESSVLSMLGGAMGLLLGIAGSYGIAQIGGWPFVVTLNSILLATLFSAVIGIFFGIYPARRASMLSPIEALRYE